MVAINAEKNLILIWSNAQSVEGIFVKCAGAIELLSFAEIVRKARRTDLTETVCGALFSPDRKYRYKLWRRWAGMAKPWCLFIGLNPSTANEMKDESKSWN